MMLILLLNSYCDFYCHLFTQLRVVARAFPRHKIPGFVRRKGAIAQFRCTHTQAPCHARHGAACVLATVSTAALCCLPRQPLGATASRLEQPHPHAALRQDNTAVTTEAPIGAPDQVNNTFAQVPAHESTKIKI